MKTKTLLPALAGTLVALAYWGWLSSDEPLEEKSLPIQVAERERPEPIEEVEAQSHVGDSETIEDMLESFTPAGRFESYEVADKKVRPAEAGSESLSVYYLLKSEDPRVRYVFLKDVYRKADDSDAFTLATQYAAKGDEIMFDADPGKVDTARFESYLVSNDLSVSWKSRLSDFVQVRIAAPTIDSFLSVLESLKLEFPNTLVSRDDLHFTFAQPSEFRPSVMWHLDQVLAPDAWEFSTGSDDVVVGVVDTGFTFDHEDLMDNVFVNTGEIPGNDIDDDGNGFVDDVSGWDFFSDDSIADDETGHGTHVSGIAGARGNNGLGSSGVNWNVKIVPLKVGDASGLSSSGISEALRYVSSLKERGIKIVATNNSYGSGSPNVGARAEVRRHEDLGILFVAASGNDGRNIDAPGENQFPAGFSESNVISVGNSTQGDGLAASSNFGNTGVDIVAPGKNVYSTYRGGGYEFLSGTSMSSPMVAGAVALLASHEPDLSASEMKQRLLDTARPFESLSGKLLSGGRLDLLAALEPGLTGHDIRLPSHPGHIALLPSADIAVVFEVDALADALVEVSQISGDAGATIEETVPGKFTAIFSVNGLYRFRFSATKQGVVRSVEKVVVVGPNSDVTSGLTQSWEMNGTGLTLIDSAGNSNATLDGASRVSAPLGSGIDLDGTSSFARYTSSFSAQTTLSAFVKSDNLLSSPHPRIINSPDYYLYFSSKGVADLPDGNSNTLKFYSNRSNDFGVWNSPPDTIFEDEWVHVLASYDSSDLSNTPVFYINGQKQVTRSQQEPVGVQTSGGGEAFLGDNGVGDRPWDGQMDEVRVYDRIVTDNEVSLLSARYLSAVWNAYSIEQDAAMAVDEPIGLTLRDSQGSVPNATFEWSVEGDTEAVELTVGDPGRASLTFSDTANARIILKANSSWGTRYFTYDVLLDPADVGAGVHIGETESGGIVWIEVAASLRSGFITILDSATGFRRLREPITISVLGEFETSPSLGERVHGNIDGGITGQVDGLNVSFSGEQLKALAMESEFSGFYSGGVLRDGGELLELLVLGHGEAFAWLNGEETDLAQGVVNPAGDFELTISLGESLSGVISEDGGEIFGTRTSGSEVKDVYLRNAETVGANRYANLSTRGFAQSGERILIGGFALGGDLPRKVLIRGVGPSLADRGVPNYLGEPFIELRRGATEILARNERWGDSANLSEIVSFAETVGASELQTDSLDAALLVDLDPGLYTVFLGSDSAEGEALIEIYDDTTEPESVLVNVSTRGLVRGDENPLIAGLVVTGNQPKQVLIRAAGPALSAFNIQDPLDDPWIEVYSGGTPISSNDDWMDGSDSVAEGVSLQGPARALINAFAATGAFPFDSGSKDSAMLIWLEPGVYTAIVRGVDDTEGVALVEVYEMK